MHILKFVALDALITLILFYLPSTFAQSGGANGTSSPKRGLVYVSPAKPSDDSIWTAAWTDLTWYYNYVPTPSPSLSSATNLEFVPMLWGTDDSHEGSGTEFLDNIVAQLKSGANITHVLAFNEPDGPHSTGGSDIPADDAASSWMRNIAPLRAQHGIKVGLPAVTGAPTGFTWLQNFNASCEALDKAGCAADFVPVHWYGNFEGLASHLGQVRASYPTIPIWVTEFADPGVKLKDAQDFFNQSTEYLGRLDYVERYSYFGAFRSSKSNVGANNAFLTQNGDLTDLGSWYLGGRGTGKVPSAASALGRSSLLASLSGVLFMLVAAAF